MTRRFHFSLRAALRATTLLAMLAGICKMFGGPVETAIVFTVAFLFAVPACFQK
jgi:hypothetical protein